MKKILLALMLTTSLAIKAQISISTEKTIVCKWDEAIREYSNCNETEYPTLFEFNKEETVIIHTTTDGKSTYYVDSKNFDKEDQIFVYDITSDVGNKYIMFVNFPRQEVRVLNKDLFLIVYPIKSMF